MTQKRILNLTSTKKRDNMQSLTIAADGTGAPGPLLVTGTGFRSLFIPSARLKSESAGDHRRNSTSIFVPGYRETVKVDVGGGDSWNWRRVVFTFKSSILRDFYENTGTGEMYDSLGDGAGNVPQRAIGVTPTTVTDLLEAIIFEGTAGNDWSNIMTAKVDNQRVTLISDRTRVYNPPNESGMSRTHRMYYSTRKTIVYDDDEFDESFATGAYSVMSKAGMGDLYIYDIVVRNSVATDGSATFRFAPEGTFYWHER